jgi:hypothetical protein
MHPILAEIEREFTSISSEVEYPSNALKDFGKRKADLSDHGHWEARLALSSAAEKIYAGCKGVMAKVANEIDKAPVSHTKGWHTRLIRRMAEPLIPIRGPVISRQCFELFDKLRAFRHFVRNAYGADLDLEIVVERGAKPSPVSQCFVRRSSRY